MTNKVANAVAGSFIVLFVLVGFLVFCTLLGWGAIALFSLATGAC